MKILAYLTCFAGAAALVFGADAPKSSSSSRPAAPKSVAEVKVPEPTTAQKHSRLILESAAQIAASIAYAKSRGASVDEFGAFCGDQFASGWNHERGFVGLVTGMMNFQVLCRADDDPRLEIVERSESMIRFKGGVRHLRLFANGRVVYGVTREEFARWFEVTCQRIAARYNCTYSQEVTSGDVVIVTLTKGLAPAAGRKAAVP